VFGVDAAGAPGVMVEPLALGLPIEWLSEPAAPMSELVLGPELGAVCVCAGTVADAFAAPPVFACCSIASRSRGDAFM
jgi:hypothetical protein